MAFLIGGANTLAADAGVANSCRFNDGDSPRHQKDFADGHDTAATISLWFKRCTNSAAQTLFECFEDASNYFRVRLESSEELQIRDRQGGSDQLRLKTSALFRDPSAWYSLIIIIDTTDGTAADRCKVYINGTRVTAFATETLYADSDTIETGNADCTVNIGGSGGSDNYLDGYMAEVVFLDGVSQASSGFGEFDEDSPTIWKPIDVSGLTFGTNGFYLDFEDSANLGNDANGGTDLTEANLAATDQTTDTPTNNFCTMNPLDNYIPGSTFLEGNCVVTSQSTGYQYNTGTFGLTAGKWYYEMKMTENAQADIVGIAGRVCGSSLHYLGYYNDGWGYHSYDGKYKNSDSGTSYGSAWVVNDTIIGVYIDLDNNKLYFAEDGTIQNSGTGISITAPASVNDGVYYPAVGDNWNAETGTYHMNFGNPTYTGTDQADANGYGSFEYNPSTGTFDGSSKNFLAICTKNLGTYG